MSKHNQPNPETEPTFDAVMISVSCLVLATVILFGAFLYKVWNEHKMEVDYAQQAEYQRRQAVALEKIAGVKPYNKGE